MGLAERFWRLGRLLLLLFVLGAAAFLSAITAMRIAIAGRTIEMPRVVGRAYPQAQLALHRRNIRLLVADHVYSALPADSVVRQSPPPGTAVKVGWQAQVVLSLGPQKVSVPDLVDLSLPAARLKLLNTGLQLGEVSYIYSAGEPYGLILQQDPFPGENGLSSPRVSVLVSLGARPPAYLMPDLKGVSVSHAKALLKSGSLQTPQIEQAGDSSASSGAAGETVVEQNPTPGARVDQTTPITLTVGTMPAGPAPVGTTSSSLMSTPGADAAGLYAKMPDRQQ